MKYEKLLLDLMEKVAVLEERIELLEKKEKDSLINYKEEDTAEKISTRALVMDHFEDTLHESTGFTMRKAKRSEGGGLILSKGEKELKVKLTVSKNFASEKEKLDYKWRSWHTLSENELDLFDFYIFAIKPDDEDPNYFVFSKQQLNDVCNKKEIDSSGRYHFYFVQTLDHKTYEDRDDNLPMTKYFNDFDFKG